MTSAEPGREARTIELRETIALWEEFKAKAPMQELSARLDRHFDVYRSELAVWNALARAAARRRARRPQNTE